MFGCATSRNCWWLGLSERTYSVIGQGLIDQALSQCPAQAAPRLFEEAAGITVYQSKRDQAANRLNEALVYNLTRAQCDITRPV